MTGFEQITGHEETIRHLNRDIVLKRVIAAKMREGRAH